MQRNTRRSGFVMLLGRPSAGKSTLVNALCGHKVSIVSPVPQTTRNTIRGIVTDERGQMVLLDTPGLHTSEKKLNLRLQAVVADNLPEADLLLYLIDPTRPPGDEERGITALLRSRDTPKVVVITKVDAEGCNIAATRRFLDAEGLVDVPVVEVGNLAGSAQPIGLVQLLDLVFAALPEGEPWYPDEYYTDQPPRFRIAEIIRERAILRTRQEVPHALYVEVADLEQTDKKIWARVFLYVERTSQQGILVGKKGATVTAIREEAEAILTSLFPVPVRLSLQVKVRPKWRRDDATLQRLIN
ncbi:MAG: GTPase Era [Spirochaeta sp.]|jgi:GTP-binding protein Era|nr:GTPase Era [Spirochaeta sp.]